MDTSDSRKLSDIVDRVSAWIPRRMEPTNVSRDFWMPDQSCRVCYECDSLFTIFNRRHHCRLCGRIFCTRCTANSIPPPAEEGSARTGCEDGDRIRVCNYCFKQWQQGGTTVDCRMVALSPGLSTSPSNASLVSSYSSCSGNSGSSVGLTPYSTGPYQRVSHSTGQSPGQNSRTDETVLEHYQEASCAGTSGSVDARDPFAAQYTFSRNSDEDTDYSVYKQHSEPSYFSPCDALCSAANCADISHDYGLADSHSYGDKNEPNSEDFTQLPEDTEAHGLESKVKIGKEAEGLNDVATSEASPSYDATVSDGEPLDFENNGLLWIPPEAEAEEDEQDANPFEDDDDEEGRDDSVGEWGYLRTPDSFGSWEEHRTTVQYTLDKSFRGLVIQLLEGENLPLYDEDEKEGWLEIITSLSWEAATLLKPDMSKGGGMDPGGYVKVKCIACGHRSESMVVKGVVCKKNVAHRRMTSKVDRPRLCILGGALEYQRVANHLSSFDTLLQQEMDHLKMAVAKIDAHHPNVLLVEKSVSRFAQDYLLAKDISLVLNIKRPLLERISRCTGAQIVPSVDHLTVQQLGFCDSFHVEKFLEEHGNAGKGGKKLTKTLMFFEGCPRPLGFTILLKGANGDELKLVKHVVQYAVFAAYHLALETSFLADEGASLPELSLKAPVKVAVPDKSSVDRSMSTTIQEFTSTCNDHAMKAEDQSGFMVLGNNAPSNSYSTSNKEEFTFPGNSNLTQTILDHLNSMTFFCHSGDDCSHHAQEVICGYHGTNGKEITEETPSPVSESPLSIENIPMDNLVAKCSSKFVGLPLQSHENLSPGNSSASKLASLDLDSKGRNSEVAPLHEEFSPSASSKKSLLVSLMTRCTWNGSVCERAHLFRIKYYGTCDRPLGRVLSEQLLDQNYRCQSCQMPSEAHIHCYTHQQGSVTVLVKKFPEVSLPREQKRKIWMWHRCLKCPRTNGFPPTTKRKLMSDATWGLSFGKFLEMCFSSHASANRVASCGHSLHRDCLRFYGLGSMVACFYYAPIIVHSVHLPPPKLEFNYDLQEWIKREADEVCRRAELLFSEVVKSLHQISENIPLNNGNRVPELMQQIEELKVMQQKERKEFEVLLHQAISRTLADRRPAVDILEINRLRRQLIIHSYVWDQRLIHVSNLKNDNGMNNLVQKLKELAVQSGHFAEISSSSKHGKGFRSCDSFLLNLNLEGTFIQGRNGDFNLPDGNHEKSDIDQGSNNPKNAVDVYDTSEPNFSEQQNPEHVKAVRRVLSDGQFQTAKILSDTLDAAWTGESHPADLASNAISSSDSDSHLVGLMSAKANHNVDMDRTVPRGWDHLHSAKGNKETSVSWVTMPFLGLYHSFIRNSMVNEQSLDMISNYNHVYIRSLIDLLQQGSARLLLPGGISDIVLPVYDDEPTSIIAYALISPDYHNQMISDPMKEGLETSPSLPILDSENLLSLPSLDGASSGFLRSSGSVIESSLSTSMSRGSSTMDLRPHNNALHVKVSFSDNGPLGKVKYTVICYYAEQFEALRRTCCPSELDFIRSLSRCKKWGAQGGKSNVFFAKTLDDRFIIKQVTKTELDSFIIFGPAYFKYLSESLNSGSPTCLAKILGIYQVASKHVKGGKEIKMDVLVMENLLFNRNITKLYDLKGSARSRYNSDSSGSNKVLLDQNLLEAMPTSPIFVGTKAKQLLERAVWNDTAFLASIDVMDYSLLVGLDEEKHELVLGIIDFMRQYTWDKHLETWVKASGILGGPKNATPTVISPVQYKKRFRKAMSTYFLMLPDQWSTPTVIPTHSQSNEQFEET